MADPYLGEIRLFPHSITPKGWARCEGQVLTIAEFTNLYSVLGSRFGGNGKTYFKLPDLRGHHAIGMGQGENLSSFPLGKSGGQQFVKLTQAAMPGHTHTLKCADQDGNRDTPLKMSPGKLRVEDLTVWSDADPDATMHPEVLTEYGQGEGHENRDPYLGVRYLISLSGRIPPRPIQA